MDFFSGGADSPLSGLGPLHTQHERLVHGGKARVTTVAAILARHGIARVGFVKIDVEGWEREVLEGARLWLGSIDAILF